MYFYQWHSSLAQLFSGYSHRQDKSRTAISLVNRYSGNGNGYAVGVVLSLPFKTTNSRNCDEAYALNIANKKLEMATFMYQEDLLTEQELRSLAAELKQVLLPIKIVSMATLWFYLNKGSFDQR